MGAPIGSELCNLTCATSSTDLNHLLGTSATTGSVRVQSVTPNLSGVEEDSTGVTSAGYESVAGLREGTYDFSGVYPKIASSAATSPRFGNSALVTFASGTVFLVNSFTLEMDWGEDDITGMDGTAIGWRSFMPMYRLGPRWRGSFTGRVDAATAMSLPTIVNGAGAAATFKLSEDNTDPAFTGNIIVTGGPNFTTDRRGQPVVNTYTFVGSGALTAVAGSTLPALLPAGALDASDWDTTGSDGVPDVEVIYTAATSRTHTFKAFLRSLRVQAALASLIRVDGTIRATGEIALA